PRMQYQNLPFEHNFAGLKKDPSKALYPQAVLNPRRAGFMFFVKIPLLFFKMWLTQLRQQRLIQTFADEFTVHIVPRFHEELAKLDPGDWSKLSAKGVLAKMHECIQLTLFDFARHSLKPTALAALLFGNLERAFASRLR